MRAFWLVVMVACGARPTVAIEIAPLPTPPTTAAPMATATVTTQPIARAHDIDELRDPRRHMARARALVVTELSALEQLLASTSASSPDRAALRRRLAEDYVELRKAGVAEASHKAIEHYDALTREHPNYPLLDEVLYDLALEREVLHDAAGARVAYFQLIRTTPSSRYVPYAYFSFAELFVDEAGSDPSKWPIAIEAYKKSLELAQPPLAPEAAYRMALAYKAIGDDAHAEQLKRRITRDWPDAPAAGRVGHL